MADATPKKTRGRPKADFVLVEFRLSVGQGDYLLDMGNRLGWGGTIHAAAQRLVEAKITEFQEASFKASPWPLPQPRE